MEDEIRIQSVRDAWFDSKTNNDSSVEAVNEFLDNIIILDSPDITPMNRVVRKRMIHSDYL